MDLYAYSQIDKLEKIAKENNIKVPRIRGYRLMSEEKEITKEEINEIKKQCEVQVAKNLCCSEPFWNMYSTMYISNEYTDLLCDYYYLRAEIYKKIGQEELALKDTEVISYMKRKEVI